MIKTACPRCRSKISIAATRCPFCHHDLTEAEIAANRLAVAILWTIAGIAFLGLVVATSTCRPNP